MEEALKRLLEEALLISFGPQSPGGAGPGGHREPGGLEPRGVRCDVLLFGPVKVPKGLISYKLGAPVASLSVMVRRQKNYLGTVWNHLGTI